MNPSSRPPRSDDQRRSFPRAWLGVARWALLVLLGFELVIRVFVMRLPPHAYAEGWGVVPAPYSSSVQGREGYGVLHYLEHGEIRTPYSVGVTVVVLGDSTVQAAQVSDADNFVSQTETFLRARGIQADLHNMGAADRTVADHVFIAPAVNAKYAPEYVVVQVSLASFLHAYEDGRENYFKRTPQGGLELVHVVADKDALRFKNLVYSSGLLSFFDFRWQVARQEFEILKAREKKFKIDENADVAPPNLGDGADAALKDSLVFHETVLPLVRMIESAYPNSEVIFLVVPYTPDISYGSDQDVSWVSGSDVLLALALENEADVRVVYVQNEFRAMYRNLHVLPRGSFNSAFNFGHLNRYGHRAVALALVEALEGLLK